MALNNYKLGDLLMRNSEENKDLIYGISDVRGVRNTKGISNTKIDVSGRNLKTFLVVRPGGFIFNHRVHDKLGLGYNTSDETYIFTNDYVSFYVKPAEGDLIVEREIRYPVMVGHNMLGNIKQDEISDPDEKIPVMAAVFNCPDLPLLFRMAAHGLTPSWFP